MTIPCAASRLTLKKTTLAARQIRFGGVLSGDVSALKGLAGGHLTGILRVEAVANRRVLGEMGRGGL